MFRQAATVTKRLTLTEAIRKSWKALALADQSDADSLLAIIKETLEELEAIEATEAPGASSDTK
jgi:hypothetical protein